MYHKAREGKPITRIGRAAARPGLSVRFFIPGETVHLLMAIIHLYSLLDQARPLLSLPSVPRSGCDTARRKPLTGVGGRQHDQMRGLRVHLLRHLAAAQRHLPRPAASQHQTTQQSCNVRTHAARYAGLAACARDQLNGPLCRLSLDAEGAALVRRFAVYPVKSDAVGNHIHICCR